MKPFTIFVLGDLVEPGKGKNDVDRRLKVVDGDLEVANCSPFACLSFWWGR
ncbi:MAG TPA: hypothetical protein VIV60_22780 [Polyangiaceae bacterium]